MHPNDQQLLEEWLDRWEEAQQRGEQVNWTAVCGERLDLQTELFRRLQALGWVDSLLQASQALPTSQATIAPDLALKSGAQLGRYELQEFLGAGSFGAVWRAKDTVLQRSVAIKILHRSRALLPHAVQHFLAEGRKLALLQHPHIVQVYDVGNANGYVFMVSQLVLGQDLAQLLSTTKLQPAQVGVWMEQLTDALAHAHQQGIIHRDIKPANILIDMEGKPYLTDFGIALSQHHVEDGADVYGTPHYMSPEQSLASNAVVDGRSDLFSLGVVLYQCLTGCLPYPLLLPRQQVSAVEVPKLIPVTQHAPHVPASWNAICRRALAILPPDRYASAQEMGAAIRAINQHRFPWLSMAQRGVILASVLMLVYFISKMFVPDFTHSKTTEGAAQLASSTPLAWFTFENPDNRWFNRGTLGSSYQLFVRGDFAFTEHNAQDAPPANGGTGICFRDGVSDQGIHLDKSLLFQPEWTISFWCYRESADNIDFLLYLGELDGCGGGGPELNLLLTPAGQLQLINYRRFPTSTKDADVAVPGVKLKQWQQIMITCRSPEPVGHTPSEIIIYLDGTAVIRAPELYFGLALRNTKSRLVLGSTTQPGAEPQRILHGMLADIRIYSRRLLP